MAIIIGKWESYPASQAQQDPLRGKRFVVVDDSKLQRAKLKHLYESLGMIFAGEAEDGLQGLDLVAKVKPDLVSLDVIMPNMHGFEAMAALRKTGVSSVIIIVTAIEDIQALAEVKFDSYRPDAIFSKKEPRTAFLEILSEIFNSVQKSSDIARAS